MQVVGYELAGPLPSDGRQGQAVGSGTSADSAGTSFRLRSRGGHAHDRGADVADLSPAALAASNKPNEVSADTPNTQPPQRQDLSPDAQAQEPGVQQTPGGESLTKEQEKQVQQLKDQDRKTRAHEQAHKSAAGSYAQGGPTFEFQQGPDGRQYAVGGEVKIDSSAIPGDPRATVQKMQVIRRAALAPSNPSGQDRKVASQATKSEQKARSELRLGGDDKNEPAPDGGTETIGAIGGGGPRLDVTA